MTRKPRVERNAPRHSSRFKENKAPVDDRPLRIRDFWANPCYLVLKPGITADRAGVVVVSEPGRALDARDVAAVTALPVVTTIPSA